MSNTNTYKGIIAPRVNMPSLFKVPGKLKANKNDLAHAVSVADFCLLVSFAMLVNFRTEASQKASKCLEAEAAS